MGYSDIYSGWKADPEKFWMQAAEAIDWVTPPTRALFAENAPLYEWFADARVNTCWNAVDRHVEAGRGDQLAIIHDSPITHSTKGITYRELRDRVASLAGALKAKGVGKGDRVIIYMPMVPEALEAMLACARLGAIHSVVFGGFAAHELAVRIDDAKPKAIIAASCGLEPGRTVHYKPLLDAAIDQATHKPVLHGHLPARAGGRETDRGPRLQLARLPVSASSRRTASRSRAITRSISFTPPARPGQPKGVVRPTAGHLVALNWTMKNLYNVEAGDVFWAASDVGWVVGHSYICYGPLIAGCTTIVYEGKPVGTPDAGAFWRVIQNHKVKSFFTAPTALRAIKREDPNGELIKDYNLRNLQALFLAGERADPDTIKWAQRHLRIPVIDHWWQTETGWAIAGNPLGIEELPVKIGSPSVAMPGYDVQVLDEGGHPLKPGGAWCHSGQAAATPGHAADPLERRGAVQEILPQPLPRLLRDGGRGLYRRGRLSLHHGTHRRRHQRRRPPALDRRDGGGAGIAHRRRRMRGDRRRGPAQGPDAARVPLPQQGIEPAA